MDSQQAAAPHLALAVSILTNCLKAPSLLLRSYQTVLPLLSISALFSSRHLDELLAASQVVVREHQKGAGAAL